MFHFHYRQYLFFSDIDTKIFIRVTSSHYLSLHNIANKIGMVTIMLLKYKITNLIANVDAYFSMTLTS